jgi:CheY-like chemotaxis protein/anti-sigma regulatory factor (Ser/Thr protein kinase)
MRGLMRPLATNPEVALIFDEPPAGLELYTDESKLGQIVRNLISNALKFTQHGEVRVGAEMLADGRNLRITVRDTGIGIAPEHHERIFQEFSQIDSPLQRTVKGTGLGLPLARKLAQLLGGTLTVDSAPGHGSVFILTVRRHLPNPLGPEKNVEESRTASDTILVVDDDATARYLVQQLFRGSRFEVVEATGIEAAERARFEKPALIILDLVMPDRSGFEVLQELRAHETTRGIPVIIHTSKILGPAELARLEGNYAAILPKSAQDRITALSAMRAILGDDHLFSGEPEFQG